MRHDCCCEIMGRSRGRGQTSIREQLLCKAVHSTFCSPQVVKIYCSHFGEEVKQKCRGRGRIRAEYTSGSFDTLLPASLPLASLHKFVLQYTDPLLFA